MNLLSPISTIMTKNVITINSEDSLLSVKKLFFEHGFHHLPVVDDDEIVGMLSKSDYLFFQRGFNNGTDRFDAFRLKTHKVKQIMTTKLATLQSTDRINVALEVFKENLFHSLPVVDDKRLVGIVTTYDIISHLAKDKGANHKYETL